MITAALIALVAVQAPAFEPVGELLFSARGDSNATVSFDGTRIVGPRVNLTRREDGTWAGNMGDQEIDVTVSADTIVGANVKLHLEPVQAGVRMKGLWFGERISLELDGKKLSGRLGDCSFDLKRTVPGVFEGNVGCIGPGASFPATAKGKLKLRGQASENRPPSPQFPLALITILPG
jgi:hypothetical protein